MPEAGMHIIARVHTDFPAKFGIPRQPGLVDNLLSTLVFEPEFRDENAIRGLEQFTHLWLLWQFSANAEAGWSPTVRPPRLGGNTRIGVFATRSPFRPNPIGLSCVRLKQIRLDVPEAPVLVLQDADLMDGTPIYDIKPYIPFTDAHPEASPGYTRETQLHTLDVDFPEVLRQKIDQEHLDALTGVLRQDPRPSYHQDPDRIYGFPFAGYEIRFRVSGNQLTVCDVSPRGK